MEALIVIITQTCVVGFLFVPKMIEIAGGRGNNNDTFNSASVGQQSGARSSHGIASHGSSVDLHVEKKMEDMKVAYEKKVDDLKRQVEDLKKQLDTKA
ncbi:hypothetical protein HDV05_005477 [Chytridiales sp. JEL 0842]|nr:hypothetical protein HDV05_005477 [Chytridiales sp. JEL 0842]